MMVKLVGTNRKDLTLFGIKSVLILKKKIDNKPVYNKILR